MGAEVEVGAAAGVSFTQTGTGALATNLDAINKSRPLIATEFVGVVADGATDCTTGLQNAITASIAQKRKLIIPGSASYYKITSALTTGTSSGFFIYGDGGQGAGGTNATTRIVQATNGEHGLTIGTGTGELPQGGVIQDIGFYGAGATSTGNGIYVNSDSADHLTFNRIICYGFNNGFRAINISNSLWTRCTFMNNNLDGFYATGTYGNSNVLNACGAGNNGQSGIRLATGYGWLLNLQDMALVGQPNDVWVHGVSTTATVNGGNFEKNFDGGFCVRAESAQSVTLNGCVFRNFSGGTAGFGVSAGQSVQLSLNNCRFVDFVATKQIKVWSTTVRLTSTPSQYQQHYANYFSGATYDGGTQTYSGGSSALGYNPTEIPTVFSDAYSGTATSGSLGLLEQMIPTGDARSQMLWHKKLGTGAYAIVDLGAYDTAVRASKLSGSHAFSAYMNATQSTTASVEATMVFNAESFDVGSNFNTSTYKFTAPVAGIYQFGVVLCVTARGVNNNWAILRVNSTNVKTIYYDDMTNAGFHQWPCATVTLSLAASDTVEVRATNGGSAGFYGGAATYTTFGGHLVSAT